MKILKAMLLAAGRGQRLRPLTDDIPKPLLSVGQTTLIEHTITQLKNSGVQEVVVNVSYLPEKIVQHLGDGSRYGLRIVYSWETEPGGLETGGGVRRALPLLAGAGKGEGLFWVVSADIWTEYAFPEIDLDPERGMHAIMVPNPDFHPRGDYGLDAEGLLVQHSPLYTYGNIAVMRSAFFCDNTRDITQDFFGLSQVIESGIARGQVSGELYTGPWFNVGDIQQLQLLRAYVTHF